MCRDASFIATKKDVFWSKTSDSHEAIINEHGLHDGCSPDPNFVRLEIVPPNGNYSAPLDQWLYNVDQDILPEWYDAEDAERRARAALVDWAAEKLILSGDKTISNAKAIACGSSTVTACGSSTVEAYDSSTVTACGSSTISLGSNQAVMIDRSGNSVTCHIGTVAE